MFILSTTRLTDEIEQQLKEDFDDQTFKFCNNVDEANAFLSDVEILLTYGSDIRVEQLEKAKNLKWIMVLSAGIDKLPKDLIKERNILITNVRGIHKTPMAEYALSMLLNYYRNNYTFAENQKKKIWDKGVKPRELAGSTLTIVGAGSIGEELARLGQAFQMKTIAVTNTGGSRPYFDEIYQNDTLEDALKVADIVVSILPSTEETKGYYQEQQFQWMKNSAVFLNMGRGTAVAEETLLNALDNGEIAHAILDVTPVEPLPKDSLLWSHEKVTLTPHISGGSTNYIPRAMDIFRENLVEFLKKGTVVTNKINLDKGY